MFVPDRRRADDRLLEWKVRLFSMAAVLGLVGIYLEERRLTGVAILLLAGGVLMRLIPNLFMVEPERSDLHGEDSAPESSADETRAGTDP